jgi:hypothetical protein
MSSLSIDPQAQSGCTTHALADFCVGSGSEVTAQLCRARRLSMAVKQKRSIHHRDTEARRRSQEILSAEHIGGGFSFLILCVSVVNTSFLLEPVGPTAPYQGD